MHYGCSLRLRERVEEAQRLHVDRAHARRQARVRFREAWLSQRVGRRQRTANSAASAAQNAGRTFSESRCAWKWPEATGEASKQSSVEKVMLLDSGTRIDLTDMSILSFGVQSRQIS